MKSQAVPMESFVFKASIEIRDGNEYAMLGQFLTILHEYRSQPVQQDAATMDVSSENQTGGVTAGVVNGAPEKQTDISAAVKAAVGDVVDDIILATAFKKYAMKVELPKLHELLKEFGVTRVTEIAAERRAEFMARISA